MEELEYVEKQIEKLQNDLVLLSRERKRVDRNWHTMIKTFTRNKFCRKLMFSEDDGAVSSSDSDDDPEDPGPGAPKRPTLRVVK